MFVMNAISSETSLYRFDGLVDNLKPGAPRPDRQHNSVLRSFFHLIHSRGKKEEKKKEKKRLRPHFVYDRIDERVCEPHVDPAFFLLLATGAPV